jgi:hypothetical protein
MSPVLETARGFAHQFFNYEKTKGAAVISAEKIKEIIEKVAAIDILNELDKDELFEILYADLSPGRGNITELSEDIKPWLKDAKSGISFQLWNRYKLYMDKKDPSFPINDLDDFTDKILDKCVNPRLPGSWDRRGMVVGHVQSGKTSNYVGLINKATDAGYKLIIVIAGTMNSLRRQTQQRIDEGFIGVNSSKGNITGVGHIPADFQIYPLTTSSIIPDGDFDQKTANKKGFPIGKNPIVLVIKKNKSILENLIDWLSANEKTRLIDGEYKLLDVPTLIIDDEADSASVNTVSRKKISREEALEEAKTINKLIRTLINLFDKKTLIGYTATPYANLFIPKEWDKELEAAVKGKKYKVGKDLFPQDFILNITAPKNYLGASAIFGYESSEFSNKNPLDIIRRVDMLETPFVIPAGEDENGNTILKSPGSKPAKDEELPGSLKQAIMSFILTCTIRRLRGHEKKHNSMLVHAMLYVAWIDWISKLVNDELKKYQQYIKGKDAAFLEELRLLFEKDFVPTTQNIQENLNYTDIRIREHAWEDVLRELDAAASKIEVRAVHGVKSSSNLDFKEIEEIDYDKYENIGMSVIAVGGSRLARGITLEGLSVSYYLRASKMYDTLMQMGRWFGYRPGYADLMRLYTTDTLMQWFNHIAMATEEMRNDFDELASLPDKRPGDYRLKVQNHHGLLTITSATKLFWAENISISFSGQNPQTYQLLKTSKAILNNFKAFKNLLNTLNETTPPQKILVKKDAVSHYLYRNVNSDYICTFLDNYEIEQPSIKNATLSEYIKKQAVSKNIKGWNVAIKSNTDKNVFINFNGDRSVKDRKPNAEAKTITFFEGEKGVEIGYTIRNQVELRESGVYYISKNQIDDLNDRQVDLERRFSVNEEIKDARALTGNGLLLIYLLDPRCTPNSDAETPYVGFSIHFPKIKNEEKVSYMASPVPDDDNFEDDDDELETL